MKMMATTALKCAASVLLGVIFGLAIPFAAIFVAVLLSMFNQVIGYASFPLTIILLVYLLSRSTVVKKIPCHIPFYVGLVAGMIPWTVIVASNTLTF